MAGDGLPGHARQDRLVGLQAAGDHRGKAVETRDATTFCTRDVDAVKGNAGVAERRPPQVDVAGLALIPLDGKPRQSTEGIRQILVGEATDGVSGDDVHIVVRIALGFDGGQLAVADRLGGDLYLFYLLGQGHSGQADGHLHGKHQGQFVEYGGRHGSLLIGCRNGCEQSGEIIRTVYVHFGKLL